MANETYNNVFVVSLNSDKVIEYHRERELNTRQIQDLHQVDTKLAQGIHIEGKFISDATAQEKAVFMANQLATALNEDNDTVVAISCSYLATRFPRLKQLKISMVNDQLSIELVNDKEYIEQTPIQFVPKEDLL